MTEIVSDMTVSPSPPAEKRLYRFDGFVVDPVRRQAEYERFRARVMERLGAG